MLENLITDRTQADFERWKTLRDKGYAKMTAAERAEFAGDMKGAYNASDLNRVGGALNYVRDRLTAAGYLFGSEFEARENWAANEIPTATQLTYYINAVEVIRAAMSRYAETPATPESSGGLTISQANDIERILLDVDELITKMRAARYFFNDLFCGEI